MRYLPCNPDTCFIGHYGVHIFPLGSAQWSREPNIMKFPIYSALSGCIRQLSLGSLSLVGFREGLKALISQVYSINWSPSVSLGSIRVYPVYPSSLTASGCQKPSYPFAAPISRCSITISVLVNPIPTLTFLGYRTSFTFIIYHSWHPRSILHLHLHHPVGVDSLPLSSANPLWTLQR